MAKLDIHSEQHGAAILVVLSGVLDTNTARRFNEFLGDHIDEGRVKFVIDLANLKYISSAGIGVLVGSLNEVQEMDGDIRLLRVPLKILQIFDVLDITDLFNLYGEDTAAFLGFNDD